jgi:hypothetical protein
MRVIKSAAPWAGALLLLAADFVLAFRPSRIRRTLAHIRRTDWREFSDAKAWLVDQGYTLTRDERYPMTSALADLRKGAKAVAIESDRGVWTVSAGPPSAESRLYLLDAWARCLGLETPNFKEAPTDMFWDLRLQLGYLRPHLPSIEAALEPDRLQQTVQCLNQSRLAIDARGIARR